MNKYFLYGLPYFNQYTIKADMSAHLLHYHSKNLTIIQNTKTYGPISVSSMVSALLFCMTVMVMNFVENKEILIW